VTSSSNVKVVEGKPTVLVLGGGYGGVTAAKQLDKKGDFHVILVDRKDYFFHNIGALRTAVQDNWYKQIMIPYTRLLKYGTVVQAEVVDIDPTKGVFLEGRQEPLLADYVVVSLGSSYSFPARVGPTAAVRAQPMYAQLRKDVDESKNIVVIGGGAVGVELAAELATTGEARGKPAKVTLIHSRERLIREQFSDNFQKSLLSKLETIGVKVVLGERVDLNASGIDEKTMSTSSASKMPLAYARLDTKVKTDKGHEYEADLVFLATGTVVNKTALVPHFADKLSAAGRLKVAATLQIEGPSGLIPNYFAVGDIADVDPKMAYFAGLEGGVAATNIEALAKGRALTATYTKHPYPSGFVSLGRNGGIGQIWNRAGTIVGDLTLKLVKSKDLMVGMFAGNLNEKFDKKKGEYHDSGPTEDRKLHHRMSLATAFKMSEDDIEKFEKQTGESLKADNSS